MSTLIKDLGAVSAYAYAVEKGYTGTEDEFASLMYDYTDVIQIASEARDGAVVANASAQEAKTEAQTASNTANEAASKATSKASEASASVTEAGKATNAAVAAKTAAETAQQRAETAQQASEDAQRKAEIAKNEAQENATIANNKASKASQYATTATNKASEASTSAKNAKTYSEQAQASATTANTKADEASASANSAKVSADNAQQSATNAQTYMDSSSTSASKAQANAEKTQSDKEAVESAKSDVLSAVDNAQNYADSAQSASQAIQNMNVEATTLEPDSDATVEKTVDAISGAVTLTYGIPKGQVGEKGDKGDTGGSGVYIGTSAPLDTNVNVWIDSDGEPDDIIQIDDTLTQSGQAADAKATGNAIDTMADILSEKGKANVEYLDKVFSLTETYVTDPVFVQGNISAGTPIASFKRCRSEYIAIDPQFDLSVSPIANTVYSYIPVWYDAKGNYISGGSWRSNGYVFVSGETSFPSNAKYVRFVIKRLDDADFPPTESTFITVTHRGNPLLNKVNLRDTAVANVNLAHNILSLKPIFQNVPEWEQGGINSANGALIESLKACRSLPIGIIQGCDIIIRLGSIGTYSFRPIWYDSNMGFISSGGRRSTNHKYVTGTEVPTNVAYLKIEIVRHDSAEFLPTEATFIQNVEHSSNPLSPISDVANHETRITALESVIDSSFIPDYFQTQLDTKLPTIIENANTAGRTGETFIFITDIHWDTNYKKSPALIDYILKHTNINLILGGGDLINEGQKANMYASLIDCIKSVQFPLANNFFPSARGNHDDNSNWTSSEDVETYSFDYGTVHALMYNQICANMGVTFLTDTDHSFYFDREASRTRFIVLDTGRNSTFTAFDEFAEALLSAPSGYNIIIVEHFIYGNGYIRPTFIQVMDVIAAYNNRNSVTITNTYDFTGATGTVQLILGGHTHSDMSWEIGAEGNVSGVPIIITDTDSYRNHSGTEGTVDSQCFDVVSVDYAKKTVKCTRIGRGEDRTFLLA